MSKLRARIVSLGLSVSKEITTAIIVNIVIVLFGAILYFLQQNVVYFVISGVLLIVFNFLYFTRYKRYEDAQKTATKSEFVMIFTFFKIYLHNGYSVYSAFKEIRHFAEKDLLSRIVDLLKEIDEDKSVQPFVRFGRKFNDLMIEEMMISLYQMIDDGSNTTSLTQFDLIFDKIREEECRRELDKKRSRLASMSAMPLVGSGLLIIMVTFGVITVMEEMISVL